MNASVPDRGVGAGGDSPVRLRFLAVAAVFLLLQTYPFLGMIWHHEYPLLTLEAGACLLLAAGVAMALAAVTLSLRAWIALALGAISVVLSFLLQFNLSFSGMLAVLVGFVLLARVLRGKTPAFLVIVLLALHVGAYLDARLERSGNRAFAAEASAKQGPPPVIHLVFDSFSGPAGLPGDEPGEQTRAAMLSFFAENGFTIFPKAYSRYSATVDSLSHAFNFREDNLSPYTFDSLGSVTHEFEENSYFDRLAAGGYRIRVYQNEEMKFCRPLDPAMEHCWTHTLPNLESVRFGIESPLIRARLLVNTMLRRSRLVGKYQPDSFGIAVFEPRIFPRLLEDIKNQPRGVAYFAHVLFPHNPFAYRSDCTIDYSQAPWARFSRLKNELEVPEPVYQRRYLLYHRQAHCALEMLGFFFSDLRAMGLYDDATIIVHGDHGGMVSRRPARSRMAGRLQNRDYLDVYSTLFAVKPRGGQAARIDRPMPLEQLMELATISIERGEGGAMEVFENPGEPGGVGAPRNMHVYLLGSVPLRRVDVDLFEHGDE